jgi:drug/metabolite transporter (DMT)-like permease
MLLGLGSALGFGFADLFGAVSAKRIGVPVTIFIIQSVNVVILSLLALTPIAGPVPASWSIRLAIAMSGVLGTVSYFSFFRALQLGPVAIVSPVFASYAAVTVILSVVFNGERLSALAAVGIAATLVGVVLASAGSGEEPLSGAPSPTLPHKGGRKRPDGIPFALIATVAWGVASYLLGQTAQQAGWFFPLYGARLAEFAGVVGVLLLLRARGTTFLFPAGTSILIATASALGDNVGVAAFTRGSQLGLVSITSAVSASFPLVVIAGSLVLFRERPSPRQWAGVLAAIGGLVVLSANR